ncbi:MAG TPA: tetratricopeptide repeat protein [Patescibacteria group bacterium]|nr:tetratricopeptide repeat protein [Patescibacteria group bacterium]
METSLAQKAISCALTGAWTQALDINLEILSKYPDDVDALNRLARCYAETGSMAKAIASTKKVLKIDPTNSIAQKCLIRWQSGPIPENGKPYALSGELFLEESGKTKIVTLMNPGNKNIFINLNSGNEVKLAPSPHKVSVLDNSGKYIGCLPDDLAARLRNFLKKGNKYQVLIKSTGEKGVSVLIKEIENKTGIASFPAEKIDYVSFTPPELVHRDIPETSNVEEITE